MDFRTPKNVQILAAGLQKILESTIFLHHLAVIFKKIYLHTSSVTSFEHRITSVSPKKKGGKDVLFYFESQNIVFRIHVMQIEMNISFQKYITLHSLI